MTKTQTKAITLRINGRQLAFNVDVAAYDRYLNELTPTNKVGPARNFLLRTVTAESREALRGVLEMPGAGLQVASKLLEEFTPDIEIELGE